MLEDSVWNGTLVERSSGGSGNGHARKYTTSSVLEELGNGPGTAWVPFGSEIRVFGIYNNVTGFLNWIYEGPI
jgi:hypothetical protein